MVFLKSTANQHEVDVRKLNPSKDQLVLSTRKKGMGFSHVDPKKLVPTMVDVAAKQVTTRSATARCRVRLPEAVWRASTDDLMSPKGPVLATATIAGVFGAKKTADLIPLCHPLPLEDCQLSFDVQPASGVVLVSCEARTTAKTGVEMEALTGASTAALCIYDMCKAISTDIAITDLHLVAKSGGKRDFDRRRDSTGGALAE